jgi:CxxC motif-containing protein (DUF1111 family)
MGFAYCDFRHQGGNQMLMARAVSRPRSLHPHATRSADASHGDITSRTDVSTRVETPRVEIGKIEPVKSEPAQLEGTSELRRSTD